MDASSRCPSDPTVPRPFVSLDVYVALNVILHVSYRGMKQSIHSKLDCVLVDDREVLRQNPFHRCVLHSFYCYSIRNSRSTHLLSEHDCPRQILAE